MSESDPVGAHSLEPSPDRQQSDITPTAKVTAGALTGALATILLYVAARFDIPMTAGDGAAFATVLYFVAAWWKKSRPGEQDE